MVQSIYTKNNHWSPTHKTLVLSDEQVTEQNSETINDYFNRTLDSSAGNDTIYTFGSQFVFSGAGNDTIESMEVELLGSGAVNSLINVSAADIEAMQSGLIPRGSYLFDAIWSELSVRLGTADFGWNQAIDYFNQGNTLQVDISKTIVYSGDGDDVIDFSGSFGSVHPNTTHRLHGDAGNDLIIGGFGGDVLAGGSGNDTLNGMGGNDTIFGNQGDDVISGSHGVDWLLGGYGDDTIGGGDSDETDLLDGNWGNDVLYGEGGNDVLTGRQGIDSLFGGEGNDIFLINHITYRASDGYMMDQRDADSFDYVMDFQLGQDKIYLTNIEYAWSGGFQVVDSLPILSEFATSTQSSSPGTLLDFGFNGKVLIQNHDFGTLANWDSFVFINEVNSSDLI